MKAGYKYTVFAAFTAHRSVRGLRSDSRDDSRCAIFSVPSRESRVNPPPSFFLFVFFCSMYPSCPAVCRSPLLVNLHLEGIVGRFIVCVFFILSVMPLFFAVNSLPPSRRSCAHPRSLFFNLFLSSRPCPAVCFPRSTHSQLHPSTHAWFQTGRYT